ncbi:phosphate ABC transporter substrate-binding protein [Arsukibacterium sp.]|uniref:phosphate ABC transporter substrate-binding protein n=1 Tax=Arsukibacterium sp. TaxID=1977258 RepID=UPI002FD9E043
MKTLLALLLVTFSISLQANVVIISHPDNTNQLTKDDIQRIYTGKSSSFANGDSVIPLNLSDADATRASFDEKALGRSSSQVKAYWSKLVFTGKGTPPKEVSSEQEMLKLVSSNPNILGYVSSGTDTTGVKVLLTLD